MDPYPDPGPGLCLDPDQGLSPGLGLDPYRVCVLDPHPGLGLDSGSGFESESGSGYGSGSGSGSELGFPPPPVSEASLHTYWTFRQSPSDRAENADSKSTFDSERPSGPRTTFI